MFDCGGSICYKSTVEVTEVKKMFLSMKYFPLAQYWPIIVTRVLLNLCRNRREDFNKLDAELKQVKTKMVGLDQNIKKNQQEYRKRETQQTKYQTQIGTLNMVSVFGRTNKYCP